MKRAASLAFAAVCAACLRSPTASTPLAAAGHDRASFTASFEGRASTGTGRIRFRGILAAGSLGRFRAEFSGLSVAAPVVLVAGPEEVSAALVAERLYYRGPADASFIERLTGIPARPGEIAALLTGERLAGPPGCAVSMRGSGVGGSPPRAPERLVLRCEEGELRLRLWNIRPIEGIPVTDPFAPLRLPSGYEQADLDAFIRALRGEAPEPRVSP